MRSPHSSPSTETAMPARRSAWLVALQRVSWQSPLASLTLALASPGWAQSADGSTLEKVIVRGAKTSDTQPVPGYKARQSSSSTRTDTPLIDTPCAKELLRVLAYPKFHLTQDDIQTILGTYLPFTEAVNTADAKTSGLPRCRDPHDQKFLVLAHAGKVDVLVTGDQALLALAKQTPFAIETPAMFRRRFEK